MSRKTALVGGAGGFIGHHLVSFLKAEGYWVKAADIKEPEYATSEADEFLLLDLREPTNCLRATAEVDEVYQLAADMGGIGYITLNHASVARNNALINAHMLEAACQNEVTRLFYSSSACVYPQYRQTDANIRPLRESDAYPSDPEEGYGWEKLFSEKLCQYYHDEGKIQTRVARFHNIYGPLGTYEGGREKAPAAICRKVALAGDDDEVQVWGDGQQTRSFTYISDCVEGIYRITQSDFARPLNLGSDELIAIKDLVSLVAQVAGKTIRQVYDVAEPQGVRGRNSDNALIRSVLGWAPSTLIGDGIRPTFLWIQSELEHRRHPARALGD